MKRYTIAKVETPFVEWEKIEKLEIDTYKWVDNGYEPKVYAALCYDENAIYVRFWTYEKEVRGVHKLHGEMVCEDSCVELFMHPKSDPRYLNFEVNVLGAMLLAIGTSRYDRKVFPVDSSFGIESSVSDAETYCDSMWTVGYKIPFSFLRSVYGEIDIIKEGLRANFYKCGEKTKMEHYGVWNQNLSPTPEFHAPQYFGEMIFEQ